MTHEPTTSGAPLHVPTTCWCCGRRAEGLGIGHFRSERNPNSDPMFLCLACIPLAAQLKAATRMEFHEEGAITDVIEQMGPVVEANGADLSEWTELQVREFVVAIIMGFGAAIRERVREGAVPF